MLIKRKVCAILYLTTLVLAFSITKVEACTANATYKIHSLGSIKVPANVQVGQELARFGPFSGISTPVRCSYIPYLWLVLNSPMSSTGGNNIYDTNVKGIGVQIYSTYGGKTTMIGNTPKYWYKSNGTNSGSYLANIYVRFIVTGPLNSGVIRLPSPTIRALTSRSYSSISSDSVVYNRMGFNALNVSAPTCAVNNSEQTVVLPDISKRDLTGVGTTKGNATFTVDLNCNAGVSVYATVTDANQISNQGSHLFLDSSSTAAGIGVQVLYQGNPVQFGDSNQFYVDGSSSSPETFYTVPFAARYIQTATNITPGSVGAKAIMSFNYM